MALTKDWSEYDHDYEKRVQDIRLKDGREIIKCWPNAGKWCCLSDSKIKDTPDSEVTHTKLNTDKDCYSED
jgi:hypothetical protein